MSEPPPRLATSVWVSALIRRCMALGIPATVVQRGYEVSGGVAVLARGRDGLTRALVATARLEGGRVWMQGHDAPLADAQAAALVARQCQIDPDLWVVEIESDAPETLLDEPLTRR
jgi:hypothetical protein